MLFIMRGTSCSGKDTFIEEHFPSPGNVLSSDYFRELMFGDIAEQRYNHKVFEKVYEVMESRFIHKVEWTILNSTNLRISDVKKPIELCKKYHVPFTFLSIYPPDIEVLKSRNQNRYRTSGVYIPESVLEKHHQRYFNCIAPFLEEAVNNDLCTFIEFDSNEEVKRHVRG